METKRHLRRIRSNLQHVYGGHADRRPAAVIKRIEIRHDHAQRVVAAAQIQHDEIPGARPLGEREIAQKLRRSEGDRKGRESTLDELSSCEDRKSTRLNSSHLGISYAVFCLKKKTPNRNMDTSTRP